ncbi:MAG: nitrous oxide reductase accessory protein NosL, partial [Pseudomonas sp.]|nr:nitrous oxide reductase accessory protein NosL [Pseudomonas sp.]
MNLYRPSAMALLATALAFALAACSDKEQTTQTLEPVAFHASDECHVCGMIIADFPGPKGEAVASNGVKKFCSTAELLGWWLQPEN